MSVMSSRTFLDYIETTRAEIEQALDRNLPAASEYPPKVHQAMRHAVFAGGKRLRPVLVRAVAEVLGKKPSRVRLAGCALEFIHTCSLILDDLPSMDNAQLRRGQPTTHRVFGEATAILAANALLMEGFALLARNGQEARLSREKFSEMIAMAARTVGTGGMIGGQQVDLESVGRNVDVSTLEFIHSKKTGALFIACVRVPAILCAASEAETEALANFAKNVGLAFQITDDILDAEGKSEVIGKDTGQDAGKATFVTHFGLANSRSLVSELIGTAKNSLVIFGNKVEILRAFADFVETRTK